MEEGPIFIVGSPRTGTTALVSGLLAAGVPGHKEGHFVLLFDELRLSTIKWYQSHHRLAQLPNTLLGDQPQDRFLDRYKKFIRSYMRETYGGNTWLEKSGSRRMIHALPFFREVFPESHIIFCKRRPLEVINSRLKKFPHMNFEQHCTDLAGLMQEWQSIRAQLNGWVEIDQIDTLGHPEETTKVLANYLGFSAHESVEFMRFISTKRPERSSNYELLSLDDLDWSREQKMCFRENFDEIMYRYGYGNKEYFST